MDKRAFLVTGGESTGTRMLVRAFTLLDIPEFVFPRDFDWPYGHINWLQYDTVLHCGMPLGGTWLNLWEVSKRLRHEGYTVHPLVMTRDWLATARSQVLRGFVNSKSVAFENLRAAYRQIAQQAHGYMMVSYEQFCLEPEYRKRLFAMYQLPDSPIDIHYGNRQHYESHQTEI